MWHDNTTYLKFTLGNFTLSLLDMHLLCISLKLAPNNFFLQKVPIKLSSNLLLFCVTYRRCQLLSLGSVGGRWWSVERWCNDTDSGRWWSVERWCNDTDSGRSLQSATDCIRNGLGSNPNPQWQTGPWPLLAWQGQSQSRLTWQDISLSCYVIHFVPFLTETGT